MATGQDIYFYKMTDDSGFAPCIDGDELLTLATCKPKTRSVAVPGDFIIGFSSNRDGARLIYVAKVSRKLSDGMYFKGKAHARRLDCIYENRDGRAVLRPGVNIPGHNTLEDIERDVGAEFGHGHVLLSDRRDFSYFGRTGTANYARRFTRLAEAVCACTQGHRVNHDPGVLRELHVLIRWLRRKPGVHGKPTKPLREGGCGCGRKPKPTHSCRS
jgi:hypothetical protein